MYEDFWLPCPLPNPTAREIECRLSVFVGFYWNLQMIINSARRFMDIGIFNDVRNERGTCWSLWKTAINQPAQSDCVLDCSLIVCAVFIFNKYCTVCQACGLYRSVHVFCSSLSQWEQSYVGCRWSRWSHLNSCATVATVATVALPNLLRYLHTVQHYRCGRHVYLPRL